MTFKWWLRLFFSGFIVIHVVLTAFHLMPLNPISLKFKKITDIYIGRVFSQNWKLFAPEPGSSSTKLFYKCHDGNQWTPSLDPFDSLNNYHYKVLPSGVSKLLYVFNNVGKDFYWEKISLDASKENIGEREFQKTKEYKNMRILLKNLCFIVSPKSILAQVQIVKVYAKKFSDRAMKKKFDRVETMLKMDIGL